LDAQISDVLACWIARILLLKSENICYLKRKITQTQLIIMIEVRNVIQQEKLTDKFLEAHSDTISFKYAGRKRIAARNAIMICY